MPLQTTCHATLKQTLNGRWATMSLSGYAISSGCKILIFSRAGLVTWKPHPLASFVDPFTLNLGEFSIAYIFPPFCFVDWCLKKVMLQQAILAVTFVPLWCTQALFTRLLSLLVDHPRFVKVTKGVLHYPILRQEHPLSPKLNLLVCRISGRGLLSETFWETLPLKETPHLNALYI